MTDSITQHYQSGRDAALRGLYRAICVVPSGEHRKAWLAGYDSVPLALRDTAPKTGPIPEEVRRRGAKYNKATKESEY